MPIQRLKQCLDQNHINYSCIQHSVTFTSQETAACTHIPGKDLAKTVMVKIDGKLSMAVIPASSWLSLYLLKFATNAYNVELADELEFMDQFPECEVGAMPPFGNLFGLDVFVSDLLMEDEFIAFNGGSHTELVRLRYSDFEDLVRPTIISCTM